jgi:hypothetical protein
MMLRTLPLSPDIELRRLGDEEEVVSAPFSSLIGALLFIVVCTRPDVAFAVHKLSQYMAKPGWVHWKAAMDVLAYLNSTKHYCLELGNADERLELQGFTDSDWAGDLDDWKSVSGGLVLWGGCPIMWYARKQGLVCTSTTEAEVLALSELSDVFLMIKAVVSEFLVFLFVDEFFSCTIFSDSQSGLQAIEKGTGRTKHFHIKIKHISQLVSQKEFDLRKVASKDNLADICTKPLRRIRLRELVQQLLRTGLDENHGDHGQLSNRAGEESKSDRVTRFEGRY